MRRTYRRFNPEVVEGLNEPSFQKQVKRLTGKKRIRSVDEGWRMTPKGLTELFLRVGTAKMWYKLKPARRQWMARHFVQALNPKQNRGRHVVILRLNYLINLVKLRKHDINDRMSGVSVHSTLHMDRVNEFLRHEYFQSILEGVRRGIVEGRIDPVTGEMRRRK